MARPIEEAAVLFGGVARRLKAAGGFSGHFMTELAQEGFFRQESKEVGVNRVYKAFFWVGRLKQFLGDFLCS